MATDGPIGRNAPCPCGSGRKFKKCCSPKLGNTRSTVRVHIGDAKRFGELVASGKTPDEVIARARLDAGGGRNKAEVDRGRG